MSFKPKFYWTGSAVTDAEKINRPHMAEEGPNEDRIVDTLDLLMSLAGQEYFTEADAKNIQNYLLKKNNWRGVKPGYRKHPVSIEKSDGSLEETVDPKDIEERMSGMFPAGPHLGIPSWTALMEWHPGELIEWYKLVQEIHPFGDLNGRVFGIIVAVLFGNRVREAKPVDGCKVGDWVYYTEAKEIGRIKAIQDGLYFVVYKCDGNWSDFRNYTALQTNAADLIFVGKNTELLEPIKL